MTVALVLDLDDTLYLERDFVRSGIHAVAKEVETRLGLEQFLAVAQILWDAGEHHRLFDEALRHCGVEPAPSLVAELVECYREHQPEITLAPDAEHLLRQGQDYAFALVTDGYLSTQRRKISALGLQHFPIGPLVCTDEWGREYWKPHRRGFEFVAAHLPKHADHFVYVADNPAKDFLGPRALGWLTIQIDRPGAVHDRVPPSREHAADHHIRNFDELTPEVLDALLAKAAVTAP